MGENTELFANLMELVVNDYAHWRRNYFPQDMPLMSSRDLRKQELNQDGLRDALVQMVAELRRSFPFHSPRYIAHQQSDLSMPSMLGSLAGMLYNANNVTSESGAVTLGMEIEAAGALARMIGFTPPPEPPQLPVSVEALEKYRARLADNYAWCHLTSGGTSANLEALWVARNVRYRAFSVRDACRAYFGEDDDRSLAVEVRIPGSAERASLADLQDDQILGLAPAEATELLARYNQAALRDSRVDVEDDDACRAVIGRAWSVLEEVGSRSQSGWANKLAEHPPAVLVSGAAHYSVSKALDLLAMGGPVKVATDSRHRVDVGALRRELESTREQNLTPLAVVAIVGTTEEGAVDPVHEVVELRREYEQRHGQSFWIHTDAAWGGYFLSALRLSPRDELEDWGRQVFTTAGAPAPTQGSIKESTHKWVDNWSSLQVEGPQSDEQARLLNLAKKAGEEQRWEDAKATLTRFVFTCRPDLSVVESMVADESALIERSKEFLRDDYTPHGKDSVRTVISPQQSNPVDVQLDREPDIYLLHALAAIAETDSVTMDPHKMGYQPYPCGAVAFRADRVRDFVRQQAPYITSLSGAAAVQQPLVHLKRPDDEVGDGRSLVRVVEAPAPYTIEGSRPSAPATGLWLSTKVLPLHQDGHGSIVRSSWRSARDLYSWITQFTEYRSHLLEPVADQPQIELIPLCRDAAGQAAPPDTNLVVFGVRVAGLESFTLQDYNRLVKGIYRRFSILAEYGDERHSYSQPLFLSKTEFKPDSYPAAGIRPCADALGITDFEAAYQGSSASLEVLRATVMNPYLESVTNRSSGHDLFEEFMGHIYRAALETWAEPEAATTAGSRDR